MTTNGLRFLDPPKGAFTEREDLSGRDGSGLPASSDSKSIIRGILKQSPPLENLTNLLHTLTSIKTDLSANNKINVSHFQQRYSLQEVNLLAGHSPQKLFSPQTSRASDNFQVCRNGQRTIAILPSGLLSVAKVL